jgi:hypothetical protein
VAGRALGHAPELPSLPHGRLQSRGTIARQSTAKGGAASTHQGQMRVTASRLHAKAPVSSPERLQSKADEAAAMRTIRATCAEGEACLM